MLRRLIVSVATVLAIGFGIQTYAGGVLETLDVTGNVPSPIPGQIIARVIGMKWDVRTIPVQYRVNNIDNPIPNPLGPAFLTMADATTVLQQSFGVWNNIPTSFIQMQIVGTRTNPGLVGFDMVNEISFRTAAAFGAIASSPSVTLIRDTTFTPGMNIDADGDPDVAAGISVATDVDFDGDIEFPAGFYKAGTILDNDVQFNTKASNGFRFTVADADVDTNFRSVDLMAVAVHEFGHSHGLSHDLNNQISAADGNGSTMFPFIDTSDPASELSQRTLHVDDIAWSSYRYPEGSDVVGIAALQPGDVAFDSVYGLITGSVWHRFPNQPVAGASVSATHLATGRALSSAFSGTTQFSFNPTTGGLVVLGPSFNILDGRYAIPVPKGAYAVGVEPLDGFPVPSGSISFTAQLGTIFGQHNFGEEFFNRNEEADIELRSGQATPVQVNPGEVQAGVDITTGRTINVNMFGNRNAVGFGGAGVAPGRYYAVRIPAATMAAIDLDDDLLIKSIAFDTFELDASVAPVFAEAMLTTGVVNASGSIATVDLASPLETTSGFLGQDNDFAPFHFKNPQELGTRVRRGIDEGKIENLFLVLRLPTSSPFPGISAQPPLIGLDGVPGGTNDVPIFGLSYTSNDGAVTFNRNDMFNFRFSLVLSEPVIPRNPFVQTFNVPPALCNGLELDGVTYSFTIGGAASLDCMAGTPAGPAVTNNVQAPNIEGNATGVLTLTLATPTSTFGFGVAQSTGVSPQPQSVIVDLFSPGVGTLRQELSLTTTSDPNFVGGRFDYAGPAVTAATIRFSGAFARFVVDGVTYQLPGR
jgi:matrixin